MKQLTIFCGRDEEVRVVDALNRAGVEGYLRVGDASAHRLLESGRVPRSVTWDAVMIVVPAVEAAITDRVIDRLGDYARDCEIEPCLRIVVSPVDRSV